MPAYTITQYSLKSSRSKTLIKQLIVYTITIVCIAIVMSSWIFLKMKYWMFPTPYQEEYHYPPIEGSREFYQLAKDGLLASAN